MEMHPLDQARALAARGVEVAFVAARGARLAGEAEAAGFRAWTAPFRWYADPASLAALRRALADSRAEILHVHYPRSLWLALLARPSGTPVVLHRHSAGAGAPRRDPLHRWAAARLDATVAISEYVAERGRALYGLAPERLRVVPYGIAPPALRPGAPEAVRAELRAFAPKVARWAVVVAQISRGKRQDVALRALARLAGVLPDLGLAFVGGEASRGHGETLRRLAADLGLAGAVFFAGHRDDPAAWMAACDALVLPTDAESFGRVLVEAMHVGAPVIAAAGGGAPEVIRRGETGLLFPPGDDAALAEALERVLTDRPLAASLAATGRIEAAARFAPAAEADALLKLYAELLGA